MKSKKQLWEAMEVQKQQTIMNQFKGKARLPQFAVPKRYDLTLKLDLSSASTFSGKVVIDVSINDATKFLVLNSRDLASHGASFTNSQLNQKYVPSDIILDGEDEIVVLAFEEAIGVGDGVLEIEFSGKLNEHLQGLYRCFYLDKGEKKIAVATQFEDVDARRCFPCWDEPALKATFKITLQNIPRKMTALSNMPVSEEIVCGEMKVVSFKESVVMSTYLVAIVVGMYDYVEAITDDGVKVRSYCPVGQGKKGKLALNLAIEMLGFFNTYFSMPYPLPKLDMVAVPEFPFGAMENYGLITFREALLLHDHLHSAAANLQTLTIVVAHEIAHHWFGNLVTMEWWTHLWLNEGFATWVSYLVTDLLFPEWKIWNRFLEDTIDGLQMDALEQSHPIEVEVLKARYVDQYFDDIGYKKGASVIRMLQNYLGAEVFQKSLGLYMKRHAFSNATTEDLWNALAETSGIRVDKVMDTWTKQKGFPVISVKLSDSTLEFDQTQFLYSGKDSDAQWIIPLTLSLNSYDNQKRLLLEAKHGQLNITDIDCKNDGWIKINAHQAGFYRVKYDENLAARLRKAVANNHLSAADELGILDDMFALCEACSTPLSSLLRLMETYMKELEYIVLSRVIDVCYRVLNVSRDAIPELSSGLQQFFIHLLLPHAEKLGWDVKLGESHLNALTREKVLAALASFDHPQTKEEATKRFQAYLLQKNASLLPVDTRKATYVSVMRNTSHADKQGLQHLKQMYREADAAQEKARILRCVADCPDPDIVSELLHFLLTDEFTSQDVVYVLTGISWEARTLPWTWLKENWEQILKKFGSGALLCRIIRDTISPLSSYEAADEVEAFFESHKTPSADLNVKQSVELVRIKAKWIQHIQDEEDDLEALILGFASNQ